MSDSVAEIKNRLSIENLVSEYVVLKKVGKSLKGLCPFHAEKTPSFIVSPDKGMAYCFGCHKGGDIFRFLMEVENIDFSEALRMLAEKTGVVIEKDAKTFVRKGEKEILLEIMEAVTALYEEQLWNSTHGKVALDYLLKRGLAEATIKRFRLGYAPDSYEFTHEFLLKKGYTHAQILQAGMAVAKDTSMARVYDRFRHRVMFPVLDGMGRVVGFGGRALDSEQQPKYLNSPETPIYQKSQLLYGFYQGKPSVKASRKVFVVEGYMDFLMAFQDGLTNIVAVNGTALTKRHLILLKPYVSEIVLSFDMDSAGKEAAKRSFEIIQDFEFTVRVMTLPTGKDIADFVLATPGKLVALAADTRLFTDFIYDDLLSGNDYKAISGKKKILTEFAGFFLRLRSSVEKDSYVRRLANDLSVPEVQIYDEMNILKLSRNHPAKQMLEEIPLRAPYSADDLLLGILVQFPKIVFDTKVDLSQDIFSDNLKGIYKHFLTLYNAPDSSAGLSLSVAGDISDELRAKADLLAIYAEEKYGQSTPDQISKEIFDLVLKIRSQNRIFVRQSLQKRLKEAESAGNTRQIEEILMEMTRLGKVN